MMTEVTTDFANSHASETRAGLQPCAFAIGAITSRIFQVRSLSTMGKVVFSAPRIRGLLVRPAEIAGKQAAGERTPHEQATLFGFQQGNDFPFEIAASDRVIGLKRVESGQVPELGDAQRFGDLPCLPVGAADVADLSLLHQRIESAKRLFQWGHGIVAMDLVQADMVGLQTTKTGLHTVHDVAARGPNVIPPWPDSAIDFRRDHDMLPRDV